MNVLLHPFHHFVIEVFSHPEFEIDQTVIIIEMVALPDINAQAFDGRLDPLFDDAYATALIVLANIHQLANRK